MAAFFTDRVAEYIRETDIPLEDWVLITPSERARQYLQRSLFKAFGKPILSPQIITIDRWIRQMAPVAVPDKTRLLLMLYEIHRQYPGDEVDTSFDEFLNWGRMLLADFDEIERYLVDSKNLFRNLRDIKEIENWSFGEGRELTENQKKYLAFWERLPHYFNQLKERLTKEQAAMAGTVYRFVAENPDLIFQDNPRAHFLFAGFNALSKAEMTIMRNLHTLGRGHILLDADQLYLDDKHHEAGMFMRRLLQFMQLKTLPFVENELQHSAKEVELIACAQATGQVRIASSILSRLKPEDLQETLVLLADESLIVPLLQNIPKSVGEANITLGLPLRFSALRTWINLLFSVQEGFVRHNRVTVYYKDLLNLWNHPFLIEGLNTSDLEKIQQRELEIRAKNIIFQNPKKVRMTPYADQLLDILYTPWEFNWERALDLIREANRVIYARLSDQHIFERAIIQRFDEQLTDLHNLVRGDFPEMNLRSFKNLFNLEWSTDSIAYYGNPIGGLQIMGLLETRLLDFKRIIALGMNEGKMPPGNQINSMIPMDLRHFVGLPLPRDKQGLFAHHFYRLLHHADEIYCTWHQGAEGLGFSEKSRYLTQIELELSRQNPQISITRRDYTLNTADRHNLQRIIAKTDTLTDRLDELFEAGASASMLKNFFRCPLDFYFKYVLRFGEEDQVEEELESASFGTLIHSTLEDMYRPFTPDGGGLTLHESSLNVMLQQCENLLFEKFKAHFNGDESAFQTGKNYLSFAMAVDLTKRFLKAERDWMKNNPASKLEILGLEQKLSCTIEIPVHGTIKTIRLQGFVDRIDRVDGRLRIVDYKTGKVSTDDVGGGVRFKGDDLAFLLDRAHKANHFFQLLTYLYLYYREHGVVADESAIISFVSFQDNPFVLNISRELSNLQLIELYPQVLQAILEEIYDPAVPFKHTDNKQTGRYCAYCQ